MLTYNQDEFNARLDPAIRFDLPRGIGYFVTHLLVVTCFGPLLLPA